VNKEIEKSLQRRKNNLIEVIENSYSPYSKFKVAASITTTCGKEFNGVNIENSSYSMTLCAEASALAAMVTTLGPKVKIQNILVINDQNSLCPPCGACRQKLEEFSTKGTTVTLSSSQSEKNFNYTLDELLPIKFCSDSLASS
jgi:cytidine deaminase